MLQLSSACSCLGNRMASLKSPPFLSAGKGGRQNSRRRESEVLKQFLSSDFDAEECR